MACWSLVKDNSKNEFLHSIQNAHLWVGVKTWGTFPSLFAHSRSWLSDTSPFWWLSTSFNQATRSASVAKSGESVGPQSHALVKSYLDTRKLISTGREEHKNKAFKAKRHAGRLLQRLHPAIAMMDKTCIWQFTRSVKPVPLCNLLPFNLPQIEDDQIMQQKPRKDKDHHNNINNRTRKQV